MKKNFEISLWLVPPGEGKVRKIRITPLRAIAALLCAGVLLGSFALVASDYARVSLLHIKNRFWLTQVQEERNKLLTTTKSLQEELSTIKASSGDIVGYQSDVQQKISALRSVLKGLGLSTENQKLTPPAELPVRNKGAQARLNEKQIIRTPADAARIAKGGVGGPEYDCAGLDKNSSHCKFTTASPLFKPSSLVYAPHSKNLPSIQTMNSEVQELDIMVKLLQKLPLGTPAEGLITSGFGYRISPFHLGVRLHEGIDFSAPIGTSVLAAGTGNIVEFGYHPSYGNFIEIEHTPRVRTRYAHLSKILVTENKVVRRGEVIGKVGTTGRSTGPHLHYEVRVDGVARNPAQFIAAAKKIAVLLAS